MSLTKGEKYTYIEINLKIMREIKIGIDNGVTGSIAIIDGDEVKLYPTPVFKTVNYTKKVGNITRIDYQELRDILRPYAQYRPIAKIERPMVNPGRFKASISAI